MYEKYNAYVVGQGGGGGEYVPQIGFGWSNAVALVLINATYVGPVIPKIDDDDDDASLPIDDALSTALIVIAPLFLIFIVVMGAYWYYHHYYKKKQVYLAVRLDEENGSYGSNNKTLITPLKQAMATGY